MKINLNGVAETSLLTLYTRVKDAQSQNSFLRDVQSLHLFNQLSIDHWDKYKRNFLSYNGTLARLHVMDREVKRFLSKHPNSIVISLGSGLDTRFWRVDNGLCTWYDLDFPEVIDIRKKVLPSNDRVYCLPFSALDPEWVYHVKQDANKPLLIICEGMIMYLGENEVKALLTLLCNNFSNFTLHLDLMYIAVVKHFNKNDRVNCLEELDTSFKWGVTDGHEVVDLEPRLKQVALVSFNNTMNSLLNWWQRLFFLLGRKLNNRLGIYTYSQEDVKKFI